MDRRTLNKHETQDVVQQIFITLWQKRETFRLHTTLNGYLYKSVLNKVLNIFKHRTVRTAYTNQFIEVDTTQIDFILREHELEALIKKEIQAMQPKMRKIYILKRKQYLSTNDIAKQLGLSEYTVNTQMKRALQHLRVKLGILIYLLYSLN